MSADLDKIQYGGPDPYADLKSCQWPSIGQLTVWPDTGMLLLTQT